ncbi:MAG: TolC family outer membrane protein [Desulfomonilaceae bacterium]
MMTILCKITLQNRYSHQVVVLLLLILMILLQFTCGASLYAMDLLEAYGQARRHDPLFGASFYEHEAAKTSSQQGRSLLLPKISASGSASIIDYQTGPPQYQDYTGESVGINLQQPLFNLARFHEYRQYEIRGESGDVRFVSAEQDLMLRVCTTYFEVLAAGYLLDLIEVEKKAVSEQGEQARLMFQKGVSTITDVHDAEARLDEVFAREIEAQNNLDIKMLAFKKIVGTKPSSLNILKEDFPFGFPGPENLEAWIEKAKKYQPVLKFYAYKIDYQLSELKKNKAQHLPTVDLVGGYKSTNSNNEIETSDHSYSFVGVQVNLPLFSGGYTTAKVAESEAVLEQSRKQYENALAGITEEVSEAFLGIKGNMARIEALLKAKKSASTSVISNRKSLNAGIRTTIDVLNAEKELQNVKVNLLQARYNCLLSMIKLKASAGLLSDEYLLTINSWLQAATTK